MQMESTTVLELAGSLCHFNFALKMWTPGFETGQSHNSRDHLDFDGNTLVHGCTEGSECNEDIE